MLELLGASVVNRQTVGGVLRVMYRSTWPLCLLIVVVFVCQTMAADGEYTFRLPEGFSIEHVAGPPAIQFPMFAALDDRGRLFVAESSGLDLYDALQKLTRKCRISVLEDRDGDGRYEHSRVFVDQLVFPIKQNLEQGHCVDMFSFEDYYEPFRSDFYPYFNCF